MPGGQYVDAIPKTQVHTSIGADARKAAPTELLKGTGPMGTPAVFFSLGEISRFERVSMADAVAAFLLR